MAAHAQLIPIPPPTPSSSPPPHSPTKDQWSNQPVDPSDKEKGKGGANSQEEGKVGGSTRAEEEAVQRKIS